MTKLRAFICFQGALAKKPYNPILGETFHCCWKVPCASKPHKPTINSHIEHPSTETDDGKLTFVAEQVSHHPPSEYLDKIQDLDVRKPVNLTLIHDLKLTEVFSSFSLAVCNS